jgi:E3 ubiquitin-protein ligase ATL41
MFSTAIISLSFVVIVLHNYARCALRHHQTCCDVVMSSLALTSANIHSGKPLKMWLDPTVIASLLTLMEITKTN